MFTDATDENTKFTRGGETDITNGPVQKRRCTDVICVVLFAVHLVVFWVVILSSYVGGNPYKLYKQRDFMGNYCGTATQWNNNLDLADHGKLLYSMNVTTTFDPIAKQVICSEAGRFALLTSTCGSDFVYSPGDLDSFCGGSGSVSSSVQAAAAALQGLVSSTVDLYTDPLRAAELYLDGGAGINIFASATTYFLQVCASDCTLTQNTTSRVYEYNPDPSNAFLSGAWRDMRSRLGNCSDPTLQSLMEQFRFAAWDSSSCPYDPAYCVPMPGAQFQEANDWGICYPKLASGLSSATQVVTDTLVTGLQGLARLDITESVTRGFGDYVGDALKTYDVAIIVAVLALVVGFICLVLLRFILGPAVWGSMVVVFILLIAGGFLAIVKANQCADTGYVDAARAQAKNTPSVVDGVNPFDVDCPGGWMIETEYARTLLRCCGYILYVVAFIFVLIVACLFCRIRLAISINKVAAQFIYHNPTAVSIPVVQAAVGIAWTIFWVFSASYVISSVPDDYVPTEAFASYGAAASGEAGSCTEGLNNGYTWKDPASPSCINAPHECWKCMPPRFIVDPQFWYSLFSFIWHNCFIIACGQCTVAGAVGVWFFAPSAEKWKTMAVPGAAYRTFRYHTGSLAFGSLILAIVQTLKWFMTWLKKQSELEGNRVMQCICKVLICFLWCFECCVKFMNKNAYIQIALLGTSFCKSTYAAFFLVLRNAIRFSVIFMLSFIVHFMAGCFIVTATTIFGYFILNAMHPDVEPMLPVLCYLLIGYMSAQLFMGVYGMSVDATLHCFIATEEMGRDLVESDFVPKGLKSMVDVQSKEQDEGACQGRLMCCRGCC